MMNQISYVCKSMAFIYLRYLALAVITGVSIGKQFITILNKNSLELWI